MYSVLWCDSIACICFHTHTHNSIQYNQFIGQKGTAISEYVWAAKENECKKSTNSMRRCDINLISCFVTKYTINIIQGVACYFGSLFNAFLARFFAQIHFEFYCFAQFVPKNLFLNCRCHPVVLRLCIYFRTPKKNHVLGRVHNFLKKKPSHPMCTHFPLNA